MAGEVDNTDLQDGKMIFDGTLDVRSGTTVQALAIAATFTAEPIQEPLEFWMKQLAIAPAIEFAPFNQVFQQLLDPASLLGSNSNGVNVLLVRLEDWERFSEHASLEGAKRKVLELAAAIRQNAQRSSTPCLVCITPGSHSARNHSEGLLAAMESLLEAEVKEAPGVYIVTSEQLLTLYPVQEYEDPHTLAIAGVPYTPEFFTCLASVISRWMYHLQAAPAKVIVLDCDGTLWKGVCGEDGPLGVEIDAPRRALQEFMIAQRDAGMVLGLCSKNVEEDVEAVFQQNSAMRMKRSDFAAARINWQPKSQNLRELARELNLGLDSFVFVDDNPLECADVRANCPEVAVLELSGEAERIPDLLRYFWAFDHWKVTREDRKRSELYQQNLEREKLAAGVADMDQFLRELDLTVDIRPMQAEDLSRVSQLTQRTNQFNFSTIRRSDAEISRLCQSGAECLVVDVNDRFGDYGLVGVAIFTVQSDALNVDTFLMSCRVLGRKVEHRLLAKLGEIALERGLKRVDAVFVPTAKNRPALAFLDSVGVQFKATRDGQFVYRFEAGYASTAHELAAVAIAGSEGEAVAPSEKEPESGATARTLTSSARGTLLLRIASELSSVAKITEAIESGKVLIPRARGTAAPPRSPSEERLVDIWSPLLRVESLGIHDNFFAMGGNSLMAVQVIARVRQAFGVELPLRAMFEAPTISDFGERIETERRGQTGKVIPALKRVRREGNLPPSLSQQRLWFIDQLEAGSALYNICQMFRLRGSLNVPALQQTINEIVRRHESLRTTFANMEGQPAQVIAPKLQLPLDVIAIAGTSEEKRETEVRRLTREEAVRPFDLAVGPLFRATLLRVSEEDHVLVIVMHHIIGDGWSENLLAGEMMAVYEAFSQGRPSPLPELTIQYADFAAWQRDWMQGGFVDTQVDYWKRQLAGATAVLELPTDRPRPPVQRHRGDMRSHVIPRNLIDRIQTLGQGEGVTLFMTLLASFQLLLSRYSGQEDIVVGSPVAGRNYADVEPLIGFFVSTLALRTDLSGNPTFRELLKRVRQTALDAYAHQDVPFEAVVEYLQPERSLSYNPVFQVSFGLQNMPLQMFQAPGLHVERRPLHPGTSIFDMAWFAWETDDGLLLRVEYDTDLFDGTTIDRALGHFEKLLTSIAAHPDKRIIEYPLLTHEERQQLLVEWNATEADYPRDSCLHELIALQAGQHPQRVAVVAGDRQISYGELHQRSNQLARYLQKRGVGPDVPVGLMVSRSPDLLVAILGILKAGGAYVPLDPMYPKDRIAVILEDTSATVLLTDTVLADALPDSDLERIYIDSAWPEIAGESANELPAAAGPTNLAYVLYTSGSTGKPKGAQIEHRNVVNFLASMQRKPGLAPEDIWLAVTTLSFDFSVLELYLPLVVGAKVVLASREQASDPEQLKALLSASKATAMSATPATWRMLMESGWGGIPGFKLFCGGEALTPDLANQLWPRCGELWNVYGPTETTVCSNLYRVTADLAQVAPIGVPNYNVTMFLLDPQGEPVPIGIPGELFIGGAGVARGYQNRPELTAEKFVANPFLPGERMYRSGDIASYLPDGNLRFHGRADFQVKIRGFRIELGEIEAVLGQYPAVKECVVMAREDEPGNKRLAGYVVPQPDSISGEDDATREVQRANLVDGLRRWLSEKLPQYMVPRAFVILDAMPLSANGKVNRRALPAPGQTRDASEAYVAPRTPLEESVARIWREVLRLDKVGVEDNFFSLGGHSLLATQVISRIRKAEGVELPLRYMFEWPTVAELAVKIAEVKPEQAVVLPPIQRIPRDQDLPLSFAQQRLWFLNQLDPDDPFYNVPLAVRLSGALNREVLARSLNEIVRRHEVLRTTYTMHDDHPVQVIAENAKIDVPVVDLSDLSEEMQNGAVRRMSLENGRYVFNLQTGPVFRASLLKLGEQEHVLLLSTHHIVSDGWSIWRFVEELSVLYEAFLAGRPSPLPELAVQYADFAAWQREWMGGEVLEKQLSYWKKRLDGVPERIELPTDRPRPTVVSYRGGVEQTVYPKELADKLKELSRHEGVTLFMTLLAAFQTLLYRYTGQEDLAVGSSIANRTHADFENLIGFFVNTLVMRTDLSGTPTFRELLQRVRATALGAYSNQDLPFERLVEEIHPERELGRNPLVQVWFVLHNAPTASFQIQGLDIKGGDVHNETSKFDLVMFAVEKPDGLLCWIEYATDLFDAPTMQRMLAHFRVLLESIVANPKQQISTLPMLSDEERHQVLVAWNDTVADFPRGRCIHEVIQEQAERTPDNVAVIFEDSRLTYRELNRRANQLAHFLRARGVGPETLVGIYLERSLEMVVAVLAVLKAGGAYVPLDPSYPKSRLGFIMEDARARLVLTQTSLAVELPTAAEQICLDTDWNQIASESEENPKSDVRPEHLAYVLFTSGSTGKPKGCQLEHGSLFYYLNWANGFYFNGPEEGTFPLFTSLAFDLTVTSLFLPLLRGRTLRVFPQDMDMGAILTHIFAESSGIDCVKLTPSHVSLLEELGITSSKVGLAIVGGEAFQRSQVQLLQGLNSQMRIINEYGPTETTVGCIVKHVLPDEERVLIGRPIDNTAIYILDPALNPVPVSVPGEIYIASPGVARGYLNREDLNRQAFLKCPFPPHDRMYRTGDLARWLPDGNIDLLGRIDSQVKIRGFRIELGEIETTLDSHPGVRQSAVMAREDVPGDKRLVAYVVPDPDYRGSDQPEPEELLGAEQVAQWTEAFDESYRRGGDASDATFNITGWDSSYTNEPIAAEEMRVWVETTSERIRALRPKRVWEIGCGTGLLMFRVAPYCKHYYGTDISQTALNFLQQQLERPELRLPQVNLERKAAHESSQEPGHEKFDAVVLNSVIQYFPDLDYFMKVLDGAVNSIRPGGALFVGDVRSLPLLEAFHTSVEVFRAEDGLTRDQLWQRVRKGIQQEGELVIDPEFFSALRRRWPQITHVEMLLKRGYAQNELTRFRYDVILHVGEQAQPRTDCAWLDWKKQGLTRESLIEILQKTQPEMLGLTGIPDARLSAERVEMEWLTSADGSDTVGELRELLQKPSVPPAVELEDLWSLEQELPYQIEMRASKKAVDGCCDVVFRRRNDQGEVAEHAVPRFPGEVDVERPWAVYANNPLRQRAAGKLVPQLRLWLGAKLPEYMVPSAFVLLDVMPLTANGKVNRRALPPPDQASLEGQGDYRAPQTPMEEIVASIFADVLRVERVGLDDNFFELGGHSLSATQVVSRVRHVLSVDLPVRALFESPTVKGLAKAVEQRLRGEQGMLVPAIVPVPRNQRLPLSFAQQRLWVLDQIDPNNWVYNMPRGIRFTGVLNVAALESALNGIIARHEIMRTSYEAEKGEPFQVIAPERKVPLPVIDLSDLPEAERESEARKLVHQETSTPFDLAKDPIARHVLVKMGGEDHILVLLTHHIASDGWSTGVLLRELTALYEAALLGKPSELPELPIQYADYAVWQRNWLQGEVLAQQLAYWKQQLEGAPPVVSLPTDRPRPEKPSFRGVMHRFLLPPTLSDAVRTLSRQQGGTAFMTMLAAFQTLILHYTKQPDIVLGTDLANRTTVQTEALIGFFVNLLALRTDLSGDPTFTELLGRVREVALGAYAHQDVPFDKLVLELQPERSLSHNPIVQVLFVYLNTPQTAAPMPGLEMTEYRLEAPSKFDMAVFVSETDKGVSGIWHYNPDLFDASTIARMVGLYQSVLEKATANPDARLSELLELLAVEDQQHRASLHKEFQELSLQKLKSVKRKTITRE